MLPSPDITLVQKASTPRRSSSDVVFEQIRARILDATFNPGRHWLEPELAAMFGVSRTPVHEALIRLQNERLVEIVPRRGMRVLPTTIADLRDIYEIVTSLEATAIERLCTEDIGALTLAPCRRACQETERALIKGDMAAWTVADDAFHRHLIGLCGNPRLAQEIQHHADEIHRARVVTTRLGAKPVDSSREHRDILAAIAARDARAASALIQHHRRASLQRRIETLKEFRLTEV